MDFADPFTNVDKVLITVNFADLLPDTVTLSSCTRAIAVADELTPGGVSDPAYPDATPSSRLDGALTLSAPNAQQFISGCVEGCDYVLSFHGVFSNGQKETIDVRLPCRPHL